MRLTCLLTIFLFSTLLLKSQIDSTSYVSSNDWVFAGRNNSHEVVYVKSRYHAKTVEGIKEWSKVIQNSYNYHGLIYSQASVMQLQLFDCGNKRFKSVQIVIYSKEGKFIASANFSDSEQVWEDVIPETIGELKLNKVCELFN